MKNTYFPQLKLSPYPVPEHIHEQQCFPDEFPALSEEGHAQVIVARDLIVGKNGQRAGENKIASLYFSSMKKSTNLEKHPVTLW